MIYRDHWRDSLIETLRACEGNRVDAARVLGVTVNTVRYWIQRFELEEEFPPSETDFGPAAVDEFVRGERTQFDFDD